MSCLKFIREANGVSIEDLALNTLISIDYINNIETANYMPHPLAIHCMKIYFDSCIKSINIILNDQMSDVLEKIQLKPGKIIDMRIKNQVNNPTTGKPFEVLEELISYLMSCGVNCFCSQYIHSVVHSILNNTNTIDVIAELMRTVERLEGMVKWDGI